MFTGLIAATGKIKRLQTDSATSRVTITVPENVGKQLLEGGSIAVNGVCLTALEVSSKQFSADLAAETLARTTLGALPNDALVNLELPTTAGSPLGGHIVQGHVDGVGTVINLALAPEGQDDWALRVLVPPHLAAGLLPQGSIALDGISLTIAELREASEGTEVRIAVIPHTYKVTNLHTLVAGTRVNIETDVLAKYERRGHAAPSKITLEYLISSGY